jgi:3-oxoacyl-[acyl-carrier protein] reductase
MPMPTGTKLTDPGVAKEIKRVAVVSGAGSGIGASIALRLAMNGWLGIYDGRRARTVGDDGQPIAPGYIADTEFFGDRLTAERRQNLVSQTHVGRAGAPQDVAAAVAFLASAYARHVTSQVLQVNGGALPG